MRQAFVLFAILIISCKGEATRRTRQQSGEAVRSVDTNIRAIFQDSKSRYWFGSDGRGVYCYDAKTIRNFSTRNGLAGDRIREIKEDAAGKIYVNTLTGISILTDSSIATIPVAGTADSVGAWTLRKDDMLFAAPQETGGIYRYDGRTLQHLQLPKSPLEEEYIQRNGRPPFSLYVVYTIYNDSRGNVWLGTSTFGACRFDGTHFAWLHEPDLSQIPGGGSLGIRGILEDADGAFLISNNRQRFRVEQQDSARDGFRHIRYSKVPGPGSLQPKDFTYFQGILRDTSGGIWMTTFGDGIWMLRNDSMLHLPVKAGDREARIVTIAKNRAGEVLLGTENAGVYRFDGQGFRPFFPTKR